MNQYRITERLSSGSFGVVFKAVRLVDNRVFVLKRIPLAELDEHARSSAMHEVELMKQLHHPHIVQHRDAFLFNNEDLCIVMDYYGGGDLAQTVQRTSEGPRSASDNFDPLDPSGENLVPAHHYLSEQRVMLWFVEIGLAIHYLHSHRIVHRDLKTHNIFVNTANGEVAVGDFGVARIAETLHHTHLNPTSTGTPLYMAPEVLHGSHATFKSDVWALGCILYELLALRHPFASTDLSGLIIKVSKGEFPPLPRHYSKSIQKLVEKMLERDPKKRPLIDEILMMPFVKGFIRTYLSIRVPLEHHESLSEKMLRKQLSALEVESETPLEDTEDHLGGRRSIDFADRSITAFLEEANTPSSKYEAMHRTQVIEREHLAAPANLHRYSPEPKSPVKQHYPHHSRSHTQGNFPTSQQPTPSQLGLQQVPQMAGYSPQGATFEPPRRSSSLEAPPTSRRACAPLIPSNSGVDDMRNKTTSEIEREVQRYRRLVQQELESASPDLGVNAPRSRRGPQHDAGTGLPPAGRVGPSTGSFGNGTRVNTENITPQQDAMVRRGPNATQGSSSNFYRTLDQSNPSVMPQRPNELMKMQRRRQLHQQCVDIIGIKSFNEVYGYYGNVHPMARDIETVRRIVPDRALWSALPMVEEILQMDREMMGL